MDVIRSIRTSRQNAPREISSERTTTTGVRLIAKLLRELATARRFWSHADLKDALLRRLARLRIRYQQHEFDDAFSLVASNRPLVAPPSVPRQAPRAPQPEPISRAVAAQVYADLCARSGRAPLKRIPGAR